MTKATFSFEEHRIEEFQSRLLGWFEDNQRSFLWRDEGRSEYQVAISELCLQRTTAAAVEEVLPEFFETFPDWPSLASAEVAEIEEVIRPLGLWRRRSSRFKALAKEVVEKGGQLPARRGGLEGLPGIGQYVASAILVMCHGEQEPLLDSNMARVLERVFEEREKADIRHDEYLQNLSRKILNGVDSRMLNLAVLDLGALVCRPESPRCEECPLAEICTYYQASRLKNRE